MSNGVIMRESNISPANRSNDGWPGVGKRTKSIKEDEAFGGDLLTAEEWVRFSTYHRLSQRELSVLVLTCQGLTRKTIASRLRVTLESVNKYCDRLHKKMNAKDRVDLLCQLLRFVRANGCTSPVAVSGVGADTVVKA